MVSMKANSICLFLISSETSLQMKDFVVDSDEKKESDQEGQTAEKTLEVNETIVLLDSELKKFVISLHLEHSEIETKPNTYR